MAMILAFGFVYLSGGAGLSTGAASLGMQYLTGKPIFGKLGKGVGAVALVGGVAYGLMKPKLEDEGKRLSRLTGASCLIAFGGTCLAVVVLTPICSRLLLGRLSKKVTNNFNKNYIQKD